jgi:hypothetical protein
MVTRVSRLKAPLKSKSKSTIAMPVSLLCSFVMGRLNDSATIFLWKFHIDRWRPPTLLVHLDQFPADEVQCKYLMYLVSKIAVS